MDGVRNRFGYQASLSLNEHLIDGGRIFYLAWNVRAASTARVLRIKTGANKLHIAFEVESGLATTYKIVRGVTITGAGTALPFRSHNESYVDDTLTAKAFTDATYTGGNISKASQIGFGSNPGQASSGAVAPGLGYIWTPNTEYVVELDPTGSTDTIIACSAYETPL